MSLEPRIRRLHPTPGDLLVVDYQEKLSPEGLEAVAQQLRSVLPPGVNVLLTDRQTAKVSLQQGKANNRGRSMASEKITYLVRRELRVREKLAAREIAQRLGLDTHAVLPSIGQLVKDGLAVRHPGSTSRGDRAPRYTKPSNAELSSGAKRVMKAKPRKKAKARGR